MSPYAISIGTIQKTNFIHKGHPYSFMAETDHDAMAVMWSWTKKVPNIASSTHIRLREACTEQRVVGIWPISAIYADRT